MCKRRSYLLWPLVIEKSVRYPLIRKQQTTHKSEKRARKPRTKRLRNKKQSEQKKQAKTTHAQRTRARGERSSTAAAAPPARKLSIIHHLSSVRCSRDHRLLHCAALVEVRYSAAAVLLCCAAAVVEDTFVSVL